MLGFFLVSRPGEFSLQPCVQFVHKGHTQADPGLLDEPRDRIRPLSVGHQPSRLEDEFPEVVERTERQEVPGS